MHRRRAGGWVQAGERRGYLEALLVVLQLSGHATGDSKRIAWTFTSREKHSDRSFESPNKLAMSKKNVLFYVDGISHFGEQTSTVSVF